MSGYVIDAHLSGSEPRHLEEVLLHGIAESDADRNGSKPSQEPERVNEGDTIRGLTRSGRYDAGNEFDVVGSIIDHHDELDVTVLTDPHEKTSCEQMFGQDRLAEETMDLAVDDGFWHHLSDGFRTRPASDLLDRCQVITLCEPHVHTNEPTRRIGARSNNPDQDSRGFSVYVPVSVAEART